MLAIIPARGGSKGVIKKNIRPLCGKPLIAYTIEAALAARSIDRIVISTDDPEIADVARKYEVEIPFMRPKELAQDDSMAIDTYIYTIDRLNKEFDDDIREFAVLLPTVPLRNAQDIDRAVELFRRKQADSVIPCKKLTHPMEWVFTVNEQGAVVRRHDVDIKRMMNRQESQQGFIPNGAVFVFKYSLLKEKYSYYSDKTYAYIMPAERSIDIDSDNDFAFAECLLQKGAVHA